MPLTIVINSSELKTADFNLREVILLVFEDATRSGRYSCEAWICLFGGLRPKQFTLSVDDNTKVVHDASGLYLFMCTLAVISPKSNYCKIVCKYPKKLCVRPHP